MLLTNYYQNTNISVFVRKIFSFIATICLLLSSLAFAGEADNKIKPPLPQDKVYIAAVKANWGTPTPYLSAKNGPAVTQTLFVFDTLVWRDDNGTFIPATADRWALSDDLTSFHFYLNPNAKWHDGKPLTADDVAFTVAYMQKYPYIFADVNAISKTEVVNAHEIIFHSAESFPPFMSNIATAMPILPKHIYQNIENPVQFTAKESMIGSGPYRLTTYDRINKSYLFTAFNDYHRGIPRVKEIQIQSVQPAAVVKNAQTSHVDVVTSVAPKQRKVLEQSGFSFISYPVSHPIRLKFNLNNILFQKPEVRKAFAKGIDRQAIIDKAYQGKAELWSAGGLRNLATDKDDSEIVQYNYEPQALSGIIPTDTELRLIADKRMGLGKVAQVLAAQLRDVGIKVNVVVSERSAINEMLRTGEYDIALVTFSILGDPINFQQAEIGKRVDGDNYHANTELTQLLNAQIHESNAEKRAEMVHKASVLYSQDVPSVSLVSAIMTLAYRPEAIQPYWNGYGVGRGIPVLLNREIFATPFR